MSILEQISVIPESINHDSTEEKLYSKVSDAVLARAFREIGLKAVVLKDRGDSADILVESVLYDYTFVADAKVFRMSRTAKNPKDFKVNALSGWRKDANYAVLVASLYQYPKTRSQLFSQSLDDNVCLFSWEHLSFLIKNDIKENVDMNLSKLWNFSKLIARKTLVSDKQKNFIQDYNKYFLSVIKINKANFINSQKNHIQVLKHRGQEELKYWEKEIGKIREYSKEKAIYELIKSHKIEEKIKQISSYLKGLGDD
jgi:type II restriction enzyme